MSTNEYLVPEELHYTKEHEWVRLREDGAAVVGITDFAQRQLTDVVYLDLPKPGQLLKQFEKLGELESVKSVSEIYSPLDGEVLEVNQEAVDHPEFVNKEPYGNGWFIRLRPSDPTQINNLLSAKEYRSHIGAHH